MKHDIPETVRRSATTRPSTFDEAALTVKAVVATATPVQRRDARGAFLEILDMATLDLSRARGAPLVDNHRLGQRAGHHGHCRRRADRRRNGDCRSALQRRGGRVVR